MCVAPSHCHHSLPNGTLSAPKSILGLLGSQKPRNQHHQRSWRQLALEQMGSSTAAWTS
ncbi:hypothetical protein LEMLEM_LOCUS25387 [Lemmus lemmus]